MEKTLFMTCSICTVLGSSAAIVDVYIMAGQSNMSGRVNTGFVANPTVDDTIDYYYRTDGPSSNNVTSGGNFTTLGSLASGHYGSEIQFARGVHSSTMNNVAIIKISDGGTSIGTHWNSQASGGNTWWNHWVSDTTDALGDITAAGDTVNIKGLLWLQGESDADNAGFTATYEANFTNLVNDMYAHLGTNYDVTNTQFITGSTGRAGANDDAVRAAQINVMGTNSNWTYIDNTDLALSDGTHFNAASINTIGDRFAGAVVPEPSSMSLILLSTIALMKRKRV